MWQMYQNRFSSGIDLGYHEGVNHYDPAHAAKLRHNVAQFSAYKEAAFKRDIKELLGTDRENFKAKAKEISGLYHKAWFDTEYHHTVAAANMSAKWAQFESRKAVYPNLQYRAVMDGRTRDDHAKWNGTILPIDDPWWDTHLPPNDWGCRCGVTQTDKEVTEKPTGEAKDTFANNPGKTGKVFVNSGYEQRLGESERKEAMAFAAKQAKREANHEAYKTLKKDPDYTDVVFDKLSGGMKASHILHNFDKRTGKYERNVQNLFYEKGDRLILSKELAVKGEKIVDGVKWIDGYLNDTSIDISSIIGHGKNTLSRALKHSAEKPADIAILYFTNQTKFSMKRLQNGIAKFKGQSNHVFEAIYYIVDDIIYLYE